MSFAREGMFPLGFRQTPAPDTTKGLATALMFACIGGVAWAFLGAGFDVTFLRWLRRKVAVRERKEIRT